MRVGCCLAVALLFVFQGCRGYIEIVETFGCESCRVHLICRHVKSTIAILEANFTAEENSTSLLGPTVFPTVHPREAVNQRCSGANQCSFVLTKDCPGADRWGRGNLTVKYACVSARRMTTFCNVRIDLPSRLGAGVSEGFVHNPGYPRFYTSGECRWSIRAPPHQTIRVTIFDLSLSAGGVQENEIEEVLIPEDPPLPIERDKECLDRLLVENDGQAIYSACSTEDPAAVVNSTGESLDVVLSARVGESKDAPNASSSMIPMRGVLFHYTVVGCDTPPAPADGYLVYRNDTTAGYSCCVGFAFPDTGSRERAVECLGHRWDAPLPLPDCVNTSLASIGKQELTTVFTKMVEQSSLSDIIVPSMVIIILFIINCIIVFIIYRYRQRRAGDYIDEELGTLRTEST